MADYLLNPVLHWLLLLCVLAIARRWARLAIFLILIVYMVIIGFGPMPSRVLAAMESSAKEAPLDPSVKTVVILGGGTIHFQSSIDDYLTGPAFPRVLQGLRLAKEINAETVIYSGYTHPGMTGVFKSEAESFRKFAGEFGFPPEKIILEEKSQNTMQNAEYTAALLKKQGIDTFYLVTSAYHMPRALDCFHRFGVRPLPHPTDYLVHTREQTWYRYHGWVNFRFLAAGLHEWIGSVYYLLKY